MSFTNCVTQDCSKSSPSLEFDNRKFILISTQGSNPGAFHTFFIDMHCFNLLFILHAILENKLFLLNMCYFSCGNCIIECFWPVCASIFWCEASLLTWFVDKLTKDLSSVCVYIEIYMCVCLATMTCHGMSTH